MGTPLTYPLRNGYIYSHKNLQVRKGGELFKGLTAAGFTVKIDGEEIVKASGMKPMGRTLGDLMIEGKLTFVLDSLFEYTNTHPRVLLEQNDLTYVFEDGDRADVVELISVRLLELPVESSGTEHISVEVAFSALDVKFNGQSLVDGDALTLDGAAGAQ